MEGFTEDTFKCGICNEEKFSIDEYVGHMLEKEECTMVLEPSKYLQGLVIPRFKRKPLSQYNENMTNVMPSFAIEVEVSKGVTRWKCKVCSLTFSREAAVINHYKLSHNDHLREEKEFLKDKWVEAEAIKTETKEKFSDSNDSPSPLDDAMSLLSSTPVASSIKWDTEDDLTFENINAQSGKPICNICGQVFKSMSIVNSHMKMVHSFKRPFICNVDGCHISFKTKGSLVRHYRRHTGDRPYKCTICGRAYRESGSLLRHQQSKVPCDQKPDKHLPRYGITLPFVNGFKHDAEMDCKLNLKKESEEEELVNPPSDDILDSDDSKAKIRREINRNEGFTFLSEAGMGSATPEKKPLIRETKKEIFTPDEAENDIEEMDFKTLDYIKTLEEEEKILRRSFVCPLCYKSYTRATYLSSHLKTHLAELGNQCPTCKKSFSTDHTLSRHLSSHSSVRQFECRQCGKAFKLKSHALNHLKSHSDIKTVPCPECGTLFKSVSSRNSHLKIHKGERNFECAICYKTFIAKGSFLRHLKVHTKSSHAKGTAPSTSNIKTEDVTDTKDIVEEWSHGAINNVEDGDDVEILSDGNDFSENDSELESFLNEKMDLSSIYSEQSELTLSPRDYLIPNFC